MNRVPDDQGKEIDDMAELGSLSFPRLTSSVSYPSGARMVVRDKSDTTEGLGSNRLFPLPCLTSSSLRSSHSFSSLTHVSLSRSVRFGPLTFPSLRSVIGTERGTSGGWSEGRRTHDTSDERKERKG